MSGRDHSCEACGQGGMNDPRDAEISRLKADLAAAQKREDARNAWRNSLVTDDEDMNAMEIHMLDAIGRGEGPDNG